MNGVEGQPSRPTPSSNGTTKNVLARAARQARTLLQGNGRDGELEPEPARRTTILLLCGTLVVTLFAPPVASGIAAVALATLYVGHTQELHWLVKIAIGTAGIGLVVALATYAPTTLQLLLTILWVATAAGIVLPIVRHGRSVGDADKPQGTFLERRTEKRVRKALGDDVRVLKWIWPGETEPRDVVKRTHPAALALRLWGIAWSILIALLAPPIIAALWLAVVHALTIATRNRITWLVQMKAYRLRKTGRWALVGEILAALAILVFAGQENLRWAILAYIAVLAFLALNKWVDDYLLAATNGRLLRNKGILWIQKSIPTPIQNAEAGEALPYLPGLGWIFKRIPLLNRLFRELGKLTIDVRLVQADELYHDIFPLSDPEQIRLLLLNISDHLDDLDRHHRGN